MPIDAASCRTSVVSISISKQHSTALQKSFAAQLRRQIKGCPSIDGRPAVVAKYVDALSKALKVPDPDIDLEDLAEAH